MYKLFASVAVLNGQFGSMGLLSGLLCCGGATQAECEEVAAKAQALYSLDHPCTILGLNTSNLDAVSPVDVKKAYKQSTMLAHPDKGGSAASMHTLEIARSVLLDPRWRKAYNRRGWPGVHAAWKKAGCSQASSFDAEAAHAQARPGFVGVALQAGRVLVVPVAALKLIEDEDDRELFESLHWLLLPPGQKLPQAVTYVDEFLQPPLELSQPYDTGQSAFNATDPGARQQSIVDRATEGS